MASIYDTASTSTQTPQPAQPPNYVGVGSKFGQAAQTTFSEENSAAGRLNSMLKSSSPLMETARLRGNQQAASRGLLGSTMGVEAAQKAMIESASPFAIADANNIATTNVANTAQMNTWNSADMQRQQSDKQFGAGLTQAYDKMAGDESQFGRNLAEQARQANLQASTQMGVASMNNDTERSKLAAQVSQFAQSFGLSVQELEMNKDRMTQQDRQFYDGLKLEQTKLEQQDKQFQADWTNKFSLESMAQSNRIDLAKIDAGNKKELLGIEAQYKTAIAGNENISNAWGTTMLEIGKIQNNPDLEDGAKQTLISNTLNSFKSFTGFWQKVTSGSNDVSDLLNFGITSVNGPNPTNPNGAAMTNPAGGDSGSDGTGGEGGGEGGGDGSSDGGVGGATGSGGIGGPW